MKTLILTSVFISLCGAQSLWFYYTVLHTTNGDPWGTWRNMSFCPQNTWANGFRVKYESNSGFIDDTALNGIRLICIFENGTRAGFAESFSGQFGEWKPESLCSGSGHLLGFQLQVEKPQGSGSADDTGANGVEFGCSTHEDTDPHSKYIAFHGLYGTWGEYTACPTHTAICGIQNKLEAYGGWSVDDTSLDDIRIFCCPVPDTLYQTQVIG